MKKSLGPETLIYPMPVLMIASYNEDMTIDCMTAAWGGVADTNKISICLDSSHKTTKNILLNKDFTVSFAVNFQTPSLLSCFRVYNSTAAARSISTAGGVSAGGVAAGRAAARGVSTAGRAAARSVSSASRAARSVSSAGTTAA